MNDNTPAAAAKKAPPPALYGRAVRVLADFDEPDRKAGENWVFVLWQNRTQAVAGVLDVDAEALARAVADLRRAEREAHEREYMAAFEARYGAAP